MDELFGISLEDMYKRMPKEYTLSDEHLVVGITTILPGNHHRLFKAFPEYKEIGNPYSRSDDIRCCLDEIIPTAGNRCRQEGKRPNIYPNSSGLRERLADINANTHKITDVPEHMVPEHIRYARISLLIEPISRDINFNYGLLLDYGDNTEPPEEFIILMPQERDRAPALIGRNNFRYDYVTGLQIIRDTLEFGSNPK